MGSDDNANVTEALGIAAHIEQILSSEQQRITSRISWLFVSQSFSVTAFAIIITSNTQNPATDGYVRLLRMALPLWGIICCVTVGAAIKAAQAEAKMLSDQRAKLSRFINQNSSVAFSDGTKLALPLVGTGVGLRDRAWTLTVGAWPHDYLPWLLAVLWLTLLVGPCVRIGRV
jgi:hypothetical protein